MEAYFTESIKQAPILAIVLVFIFYWSARMAQSQESRDQQMAQSQENRDKLMRDFWRQQRCDDREIMQDLVQGVRSLGDKLDAHDQRVDERIAAAVKAAAKPATTQRKGGD